VAAHPDEQNWDMKLTEQLPSSPNMNGFFALIQCMQWGLDPATTINRLIANVLTAWEQYPARTLERVWLSDQAYLHEIIECHGGNHYKLTNISKCLMVDEVGNLPASITVLEAAEIALEHLEMFDVTIEEGDLNYRQQKL
jgi:hypothetical protein